MPIPILLYQLFVAPGSCGVVLVLTESFVAGQDIGSGIDLVLANAGAAAGD
jgi:hypothetical protein